MKIGIAQTRPVKGDMAKNIDQHRRLIDLAISHQAEMIIFPELSITGYEPTLAQELATTEDDPRFDDLQKIADSKRIIIGIGLPIRFDEGICISMLIFQPQQTRKIYSKQYIHADEEEFFISGKNSAGLIIERPKIAFAICYEISVLEHAITAFNNGAEIYLASVVKAVHHMDRAMERLSTIAKDYKMTVLMSNSVGESGGYHCGGKSAVWHRSGKLLGQLDDINEGILIFDTEQEELIAKLVI